MSINYTGTAALGFQTILQTNQYGENNEIHVFKSIAKGGLKKFSLTSGVSCGLILGGIVSNHYIVLATRDLLTMRKLLAQTNFLTTTFLSSVVFLVEPGGLKSLSSLASLILSRPKQFISNLINFSVVGLAKFYLINRVESMLLNYYLTIHSSPDAKSYARKLWAIYMVLKNPIISSLALSLLVTPFRNISNQYCKLLVESRKDDNDSFSLFKLNPITVTLNLIKEKGLLGALYSGVSITFLMGITKQFGFKINHKS